MRANLLSLAPALFLSLVAVAGCKQGDRPGNVDEGPQAAAADKAAAGDVARSPGKPTAPVTLEYEVIGSAIVGQPVGINLRVAADAPGLPVTLHYRIVDSASLVFADAQPQRVEMTIADDNPRLAQVTVIPQREGRVYLNVSAEVQTENGAMFRAMAIPVQVGAAPPSAPDANGELKETAEGETVLSMPAEESTDPR